MTRMIGCAAALLLSSCAHRGMSDAKNDRPEQFAGSTPGDALVREFLGGLAGKAECHSVAWQLTLFTNSGNSHRGTYHLAALYHVPARGNTNQSVDGPQVIVRGTWEADHRAKFKTTSVVYRLHAEEPRRSLSFVKIGDHLLHLLNADGSLAIGTGGWSYTLNRAGHSEKTVDASLAMSAPDMSYKIAPLATGPTVFGVFEGRTPCHGISGELKLRQHAGCTKAKWRVTLYQNPETAAPTTYKVEGTLFRQGARQGTWGISRGAKSDQNATVYELRATNQPALRLLQGDDNVLFFLNASREPMIGNADFSYTLNHVRAK